ncbi:MAG: lysophospholipid acyltransferase family protein [Candidatus Methylacidiphilales bacterium]
MIPAQKDPFLDSVLYFYLKRMLRRYFHTVRVAGLEHLTALEKTRPAIAFANHSNWWDGVLLFYLSRFQRNKDFYCMMEEKQMLHYPFFSWLGAFSVNLDNPILAGGTVRYTCKLLRENRTLIWIFPQGRMVRPREPISIKPGVDFLAKRFSNARMLPVAFHYAFEREQKPVAYIHIGPSYSATDNSDDRLRAEMEQQVAALWRDEEQADWSGYQTILKPTLSINKRWEWVKRLCNGTLADFDRGN